MPVKDFTLVGENIHNITVVGRDVIPVTKSEQIYALAGDVIAVRWNATAGNNVICQTATPGINQHPPPPQLRPSSALAPTQSTQFPRAPPPAPLVSAPPSPPLLPLQYDGICIRRQQYGYGFLEH